MFLTVSVFAKHYPHNLFLSRINKSECYDVRSGIYNDGYSGISHSALILIPQSSNTWMVWICFAANIRKVQCSFSSTPCYPNHHLAQPKSQQHHLQHTSTHVVLYNLHASVFDYLPITAVDFIEARIFFLTGIRACASKARIVACISFKHFKNRRPHHLITLISTFWTSETFSEREGMLTGPTVSTWRHSMTHLCFWPTLTLDVAVLCNQVLNFCIRY